MEDLAILRLNIERYRRLLQGETDFAKRQNIAKLLQEARAAEMHVLVSKALREAPIPSEGLRRETINQGVNRARRRT